MFFTFYGSGGYQPVHNDLPGLPDAVGAIC